MYDLNAHTTGAVKEGLTLHSQTVQAINEEFVRRRKQFKKLKLNWRVSDPKSSKRSLGWIPFKKSAIKYKNGQVHYQGKPIGLWDSHGLSNYELGSGSFSQDTRGRWYFNTTIKVTVTPSSATSSVGIDLGLKEAAVASDGQRIEGRFYRKLEQKLGIAQRAEKKDRARAIHAKIANQRKDILHKFSTKIVNENAAVFVGNVSSAKLVKTKMAKSTLDAGWSMLKTMLKYKSHRAGVVFQEVNEAFSTQTCYRRASTMKVTTVGIDLAKNVLQIHGADENGKPLVRRQLKRNQVMAYFANLEPCLIGMEACGSSHHWARQLQSHGHEVRLISPQFVKPYVKTNKHDVADAEAISEAVTRPTMRFVPIKNIEQQAMLSLHRAREGFIGDRTATANGIRGLMSEFGLIIPQGIAHVRSKVPELIEDATNELRGMFRVLID